MSIDVPVLRESFVLVAERAPNLTARFYAILFERYPELRRLFGPSLGRQEQMLGRALAAVVDRVEDGEWLTTTLHALGAKHVDYGVTEEMYASVGDALLAALGEALGDDWTARTQAAWTGAYGAIAALMIEGARKVAFQSPSATSLTPSEVVSARTSAHASSGPPSSPPSISTP